VGKIGDLGLAKLKSCSYGVGNMRGTLPWMAPELLPDPQRVPEALGGDGGGGDHEGEAEEEAERVTEKIDVYSFGVLLWEIWTWGACSTLTLTLTFWDLVLTQTGASGFARTYCSG
jgi:serine/threonine protein kinase